MPIEPHADLAWLTARPIAHRGLHDGNLQVPENSLAAARAAIAGGYAIECDVQFSADETPHVFHDETLERMTGAAGRIRERSDADLAALSLVRSAEPVPTLARLLAAVAGRVPLVIELKGHSAGADAGYLDAVRRVVRAYDGPLALMSFDPWLVEQALAADLKRPVGLTAAGGAPDELAAHRRLFEAGCAFASYRLDDLPNAFSRFVREECAAPLISWTVRSPKAARHSATVADQITFEGFTPQA